MAQKNNPFASFASAALDAADDPVVFTIEKSNVSSLMETLNKIMSTTPEVATFNIEFVNATTGWSGITVDFEEKKISIQL